MFLYSAVYSTLDRSKRVTIFLYAFITLRACTCMYVSFFTYDSFCIIYVSQLHRFQHEFLLDFPVFEFFIFCRRYNSKYLSVHTIKQHYVTHDAPNADTAYYIKLHNCIEEKSMILHSLDYCCLPWLHVFLLSVLGKIKIFLFFFY